MRKKAKYSPDLPRRMYAFFNGYSESGLPSFGKFARSVGMTLEELTAFKGRKKFDAAWRECIEIKRDYLIDTALSKRADSSFAKFLYSLEFQDSEESSEGNDLSVTLEVLEK